MSSVENILPKKQIESVPQEVQTVFSRVGKKLRKVSRWAVGHIEYGLRVGTAIGIADDIAAIAENVFRARWVGQAAQPLHAVTHVLGAVFAPLWFIVASFELYGEYSSEREPAQSVEELGQRVFHAASTVFRWGESVISLGVMVCSFISSAIAVIPILGLVDSIISAPAALFKAVSQGFEIKNLEEKKKQDSQRVEHRKLWHKLAKACINGRPYVLDGLRERYRIRLMKIDAKLEGAPFCADSPILAKKRLRTIALLQQIDRNDVAGLIEGKRLRMIEVQEDKLRRAVQKKKIKSISKQRKKWVREKEIRERHLSCLRFPNSTKSLITERFALLLNYRTQEAKTQLKNRKIQQKRAILGVVANVSICSLAVTGTVLGAVALSGVGLPLLVPVAISLAWGTISLTKFLINKFVFREQKAPSLEKILHEQEVKEKI